MKRETTIRSRPYLSTVGGYMALAYGAAHVVIVPLRRHKDLSQAWAQGWWGGFTLDEPTTLAEAERALTFWQTLGSFGVPMVALGAHLVWSGHQRRRVPGWLGWVVLAWGLPFVSALPKSPGWALPVIGGLIVAGDAGGRPARSGAQARRRSGGSGSLRAGHLAWF